MGKKNMWNFFNCFDEEKFVFLTTLLKLSSFKVCFKWKKLSGTKLRKQLFETHPEDTPSNEKT